MEDYRSPERAVESLAANRPWRRDRDHGYDHTRGGLAWMETARECLACYGSVDVESRRRALAYLLGRFSGKSWASGEVMVPEQALSYMAAEGIGFTVEGPASYERILRLNQVAGTGDQERKSAANA